VTQSIEERMYLFDHGNTTGAVLRVLSDESRSLNSLLPEALRQTPDRQLSLSYSCCYLHHRNRNVMIDAGIDGDSVLASLLELGVSGGEVELVCITHVDRDHVAGLLLQIGDGQLTFPNAQYAIDAMLWDELRKPETYESLPKHLRRLFQRLKVLIEDKVILCDGETELHEGITFVPCPGHRPGHAAYQFDTSKTPILHIGDAILHPIFAEHLDWPNTGDSLPHQAMKSRVLILDRARALGALTLGTHFPWPGLLTRHA